MASGKICTSSALWLPSARGIAMTPKNEPCLMSERDALTTPAICGLSASATFSLAPSRVPSPHKGAIETFDGAPQTNRILRQGRCDTRYHHHESAKTDARKRRDCHFVISLHEFLQLPRAHLFGVSHPLRAPSSNSCRKIWFQL